MSDQHRDRDHEIRNRQQKEMRQQEQSEGGRREQGGSLDHHGLAGQQDREDQSRQQAQGEAAGRWDQQGLGQGSQKSDGSRQMGWSQNADDIGRQYDQSGFAEGGGGYANEERSRQQGWSGETRADRQQFQSEYDQQIQDDGSMTREQKLQQGWQNPEDPSQIADEGLIDEDEEDTAGGRI